MRSGYHRGMNNVILKNGNMRIIYSLFLLGVFLFNLVPIRLQACTTVIAGRNTTTDGSILFVKSEDDYEQLDYYWFIPRKRYGTDAVIFETRGLAIPQVSETYAYFWDQSPKLEFSNVIINEWGVAFGSNACRSKEDPADVLEKRGDIVQGGIGFNLRFILAERCKTAREAVLLAAALINRYGYNASGRCLNIVDPGEAWQLQMVCGKHFVARRVQDNEVAIIANTYNIREIDIHDTANFICSPDIIDYAIKRGWYDPAEDSSFDFARAYAPDEVHKANGNTHRTWMIARMLQKDFPLSLKNAENGQMPVSVQPDRKLALRDMINIFRNHYENTELCTYMNENISPHHVTNNPVCSHATHKVNIIQQRNWLPREIGTVNWRALSHPCQSVFIPWYSGITRIPHAYQKAYEDAGETDKARTAYHFSYPSWQLSYIDPESASCVFRLLNNIGDSRYTKNHELIRKYFDRLEAELINKQAEIEKTASDLFNKDKNKATEFLTDYTNTCAMKGYRLAKDVLKKLIQ